MKAIAIILASFIAMTTLSACSTKNNVPAIEANDGVTGYWYLGDNGQRQWRTLTPGEIKPPVDPVVNKYPRSMGNGSGRG